MSSLDPATVEAIAQRVAQLLESRLLAALGGSTGARLVDAAELALALGVSRDFIYAHIEELGGVRLGDGPRPRLRFDLERARTAWAKRDAALGTNVPKPARPHKTVAAIADKRPQTFPRITAPDRRAA